MKKNLLSLLAVWAINGAGARTINISGNLTGTNNWISTNTSILNGPVYLISNAHHVDRARILITMNFFSRVAHEFPSLPRAGTILTSSSFPKPQKNLASLSEPTT